MPSKGKGMEAEAEDYLGILWQEIEILRKKGVDTRGYLTRYEQARDLLQKKQIEKAIAICKGTLSEIAQLEKFKSEAFRIQKVEKNDMRLINRYRIIGIILLISIIIINIINASNYYMNIKGFVMANYEGKNPMMRSFTSPTDIYVHVKNESGMPMANVTVLIYRYNDPLNIKNGGYNHIRTKYTDHSGTVSFQNLYYGTYRIEAVKTNHSITVYDVSIASTGGEKHLYLNLKQGNTSEYYEQKRLEIDEIASITVSFIYTCVAYITIMSIVVFIGIIALLLKRFYKLALASALFGALSIGIFFANVILGFIALYIITKTKPIFNSTNKASFP